MQLRRGPRRIRASLAAATAGLLGQNASALEPSSDWEVDSAVLYYSEQDRVSLFEPVVRARRQLANDQAVSMRLVVDSLTGSSANGAIATGQAQTFTTPSGNSTYTTAANQTPLDPTFQDTRVALNGAWELPLGERTRGIFGANFSTEYDYQSAGLSATFNWDFNQRNSTLIAGLAYNADTVDPVGGVPLGLTPMPVFPAVKQTVGADDDKTVYDLLLGWTQVLGPKTLMQLNYVYGNESGYLTDPYKIVSVVDGATGQLVADPGRRYLYEKRPDDRTRHSLYWGISQQFARDVLRASYRYFTDDWGIDSHTLDARYRWELGRRYYLEPHLRYYTQGAADFYRTSLVEGEQVEHVSADYRLADLTTTTAGVKLGWGITPTSEFSVRAEYMLQQADPSEVIGVQANQDLTPDVEAVILQLGYILQF